MASIPYASWPHRIGGSPSPPAGKTVSVVHSLEAAVRLGTYYSYSVDDTLLMVQAFDPAVAAEALAALP